jgi:hypothetical protein
MFGLFLGLHLQVAKLGHLLGMTSREHGIGQSDQTSYCQHNAKNNYRYLQWPTGKKPVHSFENDVARQPHNDFENALDFFAPIVTLTTCGKD